MTKVSFEFKFPDLASKLKKHEDEIQRFVAAQMQFNRGMLFDKEGAYNGHTKWPSLKLRTGQILSKRGTLRKSMAPTSANGTPGPDGIVRFSGPMITIGTKLIYASMMNWGTSNLPDGVLRPKNALALMIPIPGGKSATEGAKALAKTGKRIKRDVGGKTKSQKVIFRKYVRIPPRRFDDWTTEDQYDLDVALTSKLTEVLSR